ncbi:hypothetical protein [Arthrobacter sp. UM1]|uniref:hypothetical protein n=1 Tax=Arthrobacter sp. UM1 TaxID=2766776 RepID=UPI001CF6FD57|nr:hypothetical protein [Arthrobacter sp. UM1]MCB4208584.1 hypothetical protein [Arthrobacter sp. UM1]
MSDPIDVVLFRYSPRPVELWHLNDLNVRILTLESGRDRYFTEPKVDEEKVTFLEDFEVHTLFRTIRSIREEGPIRSISTLGEDDMDIAGLLQEFFVSGLSDFAVGTLFKDKLLMRAALEGVVPQPSFRGLSEFTGTRTDLIDAGFGIIKPRRSAGAQGVARLEDLTDEEFTALNLRELLAESFVDTPRMVTGDGFAVGHEMQRFCVHEYDAGVLSSLKERRHGIALGTSRLYDESVETVKTLFDLSSRVIETIGSSTRVTPFHFEWFVPAEGDPVFCEVGLRFGGMSIPRMVSYAFDCPLIEEYWAAMFSGRKAEQPLDRDHLDMPVRRAICYGRYRRSGTVVSAPAREDFPMAHNVWIWVKAGDEGGRDASVVSDNAGMVELIGDSHEDVLAKLAMVEAIMDEKLVVE